MSYSTPRWLMTATLAALLIMPSTAISIERLSPEPVHTQAGPVVGQLLSRYHYRDQSLDEELSRKVYDAYFEALDPERYYFLEEDLMEFRHRDDSLAQELRSGRLDTAFDIFARYRQRVEQRSDFARDILDTSLDFTTDETFDPDRREAGWAESRQELDEIWRKRIAHDALTQMMSGRQWDEVRESLQGRYQRVATNLAQYDAEDVFQAYMSTWAGQFDPHSSYMSPRRSENFDINMRLSLEGIGAMLSSEGDFVEVVELISGGPAANSGQISSGDRIVGVGQEADAIEDVVGRRLSDVVDLIRGPKGSTVYLRILPDGADGRERTIALERNTVELEEQAAQAEVREVEREGETLNIGVITLPAFYADFEAASAGDEDYRSTTEDVRRLLESDKLAEIDGLIIDLRGNSGGSLEEAVRLTSLFLNDGPVVQVNRSNGRREVLRDTSGQALRYTGPLGVMVDHGSASASEIFAAAVQDYGRGVIMGNQTFGKGTVQSLVGLDRFGVGDANTTTGRLKLTIAKFYRVNGESTQLEGVTPDLALPSPFTSDESGERAADRALPWNTISAADYRRVGTLDAHLDELRVRHLDRLSTEPALISVAREAELLREERRETEVSLNEEVRRATMEARDQARLEATNARLAAYGRPLLESLEDKDRDELPDVLLDEGVEVLGDLAVLMASDRSLLKAQGAAAN